MTKEEFKEKFKVGDIITNSGWIKNLGDDHYTCIKYIGDDSFVGLEQSGFESFTEISNLDWQHYKEPVKKDLEGLVKYYVLRTLKDYTKHIRIFYSNDYKHLLNMINENDEKDIQVLTEQQAIERGLKI